MGARAARMAKQKQPRSCRTCGNLFAPRRVWQQFCSTKCHNLWHARERQQLVTLAKKLKGES